MKIFKYFQILLISLGFFFVKLLKIGGPLLHICIYLNIKLRKILIFFLIIISLHIDLIILVPSYIILIFFFWILKNLPKKKKLLNIFKKLTINFFATYIWLTCGFKKIKSIVLIFDLQKIDIKLPKWKKIEIIYVENYGNVSSMRYDFWKFPYKLLTKLLVPYKIYLNKFKFIPTIPSKINLLPKWFVFNFTKKLNCKNLQIIMNFILTLYLVNINLFMYFYKSLIFNKFYSVITLIQFHVNYLNFIFTNLINSLVKIFQKLKKKLLNLITFFLIIAISNYFIFINFINPNIFLKFQLYVSILNSFSLDIILFNYIGIFNIFSKYIKYLVYFLKIFKIYIRFVFFTYLEMYLPWFTMRVFSGFYKKNLIKFLSIWINKLKLILKP